MKREISEDEIASLMAILLLGFSSLAIVVLIVCAWCAWRQRRSIAELQQLLQAERDRVTRLPESMRHGSSIFNSPPLRAQFGLWEVEAGSDEKFYLGSGYRDLNTLVTCQHVVDGQRSKTQLWLSTSDGKYTKLADDKYPFADGRQSGRWTVLATDVVAMPYDQAIVGLTQASIGPVSGKVMAMCISPKGNGSASIGILDAAPPEHGFATLVYQGSTNSGMSGGVYASGPQVVGLHAGGGTSNYGFASSYIRNRVVRYENTGPNGEYKKPESSEFQALLRALQGARGKDWTVKDTGYPDEVEVRVGGRYFMVDRDDWNDYMDEYHDLEDYDPEDRMGGYNPKQGRRARRKANYVEYARPDREFATDADMDDWYGRVLDQYRDTDETYAADYSDTYRKPEGNDRMEVDQESDDDVKSENSNGSQNTAGPSVTQEDLTIVQQEITAKTQSTIDSMLTVIAGLEQRVKQLQDRLETISSSEKKPYEDFIKSVNQKLDRLSENSVKPTRYALDVPQSCQQKKDSESGLNTASGNATLLPPQDSASSNPRVQLVSPWDGMESDLRKLTEWRSSMNSSAPSFAGLQQKWAEDNGISPGQLAIMLANLRNKAKRLKNKAKKARVTGELEAQIVKIQERSARTYQLVPKSPYLPTTSKSSLKMSPSKQQKLRQA
uniref:Serine protease n=1 Tax=Riboviria sp. TaxID=2585031 RepID=A0A8K1U356_9VIRU|nr:MAG: hypothetical protein 2 [Riboviria sp.]